VSLWGSGGENNRLFLLLLNMKIILNLITLSFLTTISHAQINSCSLFRNGKFKTTYNGTTAIVDRKGTQQSEYFIRGRDTIRLDFTVKWIDDCIYTLTPDSEAFKKNPKMPKNAVITVKITDPKTNSYTQTATSNFSDKIFISEMILLPNN
jgi:hypothetical protein